MRCVYSGDHCSPQFPEIFSLFNIRDPSLDVMHLINDHVFCLDSSLFSCISDFYVRLFYFNSAHFSLTLLLFLIYMCSPISSAVSWHCFYLLFIMQRIPSAVLPLLFFLEMFSIPDVIKTALNMSLYEFPISFQPFYRLIILHIYFSFTFASFSSLLHYNAGST